MYVYLDTLRSILRRFTADDVDNLIALDGDPDVMRYITGGRPTPRDEIRDDTLPRSSPGGLLVTAATVPVRLPWGPYAVPAPDRAALCGDLRRNFTPPFVHHVALALTGLELPAVASAPVLVLMGGREPWGSRAAARRVVGRIQGTRGGVVPRVGHLWNLQAPDLFAAILRAWVGGGALHPAVQRL